MASATPSSDYRVAPFDLLLLVAVVEHGSITAAAEAVSLSLAAASERLKALEASVGARLFDRSKSGAAPTAAGTAMVRHSRRVLRELDSLHHEMASFGSGLRGTLRVAGNTVALAEILPPCLGRFLLRYPDLDLDVRELSSEGVLEALHGGIADLGIVSDYADTGDLVTRPWAFDQLVAVMPKSWPATRRRSIEFGDLLDRPFVGLPPESGLSRLLAAQASRSGRALNHRVRLTNFDAIGQVVSSGVGVAVVPGRAARRLDPARVRCLPLADPWAKRRLLVCTTALTEPMASVKALVGVLLESTGQEGGLERKLSCRKAASRDRAQQSQPGDRPVPVAPRGKAEHRGAEAV